MSGPKRNARDRTDRALETRLFGVGAANPVSLAFALALAIGIAAPLRRVLAVEPAALMRAD